MALVDEALDGVETEYEDKLAPSIPRIWAGEIASPSIRSRVFSFTWSGQNRSITTRR